MIKQSNDVSLICFQRSFIIGVALFIILGIIAGFVADFSKVKPIWYFAYLFWGYALLLTAIFPVAKRLKKRDIW